jgi:hypothetical protein
MKTTPTAKESGWDFSYCFAVSSPCSVSARDPRFSDFLSVTEETT